MKSKKLYTVLLCAVLACPVFAVSMKESTENWTKRQETPTAAREGVIDENDMNNVLADPSVPVGEMAWLPLLGLGIAYGAVILTRKKRVD